MDARDALASLDLPYGDPYHDRRIPCADDSRIGSALKAFSAASPVWQASFREAIDFDRADLLCVWSERIAALAVRLDSARPLALGLVALSLADESEPTARRSSSPRCTAAAPRSSAPTRSGSSTRRPA